MLKLFPAAFALEILELLIVVPDHLKKEVLPVPQQSVDSEVL